jgi:DNA-binding GntR family transcriptional regulator
MTEEGLNELSHIIDLMDFYYAKWDPEHLRRADDDFHETICRLSKRTVIKDTLIPLHRKTRRYRRIAMDDPDRVPRTLKEHRAICEAIVAGNAELAQQLRDAVEQRNNPTPTPEETDEMTVGGEDTEEGTN